MTPLPFTKNFVWIHGQGPKGPFKLYVELAATFWLRALGLSWRRKLDSQGMLFVFKKPGRYPFWMFGMRFPIDLVWISNGLIVGIEENLKVPSRGCFLVPFFLKHYVPPQKIDGVLELNAGDCHALGIKKGEMVRIT